MPSDLMAPVRPRVILIVARARNGVIGQGNRLPWHLPEELRQFKTRTMHHALIIGRATWESIGRALPGRRMIVLTAQPGWQAEGCEKADSLAHALRIAATADPSRPQIRTDQAFVAGGAQVYRQALPIADQMLVTQVDLEPDGDVHFEAPDPDQWQLVTQTPYTSADGIGYAVQDWRRRR
ncbi:MAG: dihydrofolate reductase [Burkholderiaceae bacterium]